MKTICLLLAVLAVMAHAGSIKLAWDAPAEEGSIAYTLEAVEGNGVGDVIWTPIQSTANTFLEINGLKPGPWSFRLRAVTLDGTLQSDPSNIVTTIIRPDTPKGLRVTLQSSVDMQTWTTVAKYDVPEADRAFYRIAFQP